MDLFSGELKQEQHVLPQAERPRSLSAPWTIFWTGFIVRIVYILLAHTYRIRLQDDHFQFGWEMGRVGRALATGYGFADPFTGHTGPTAWFPPLYPLLIGASFKLFGVYTKLAAFALFAVNSIFSAATAPALYQIGVRSFNRRVALWAAWIWALYPAAIQYATHWIWDMAITTCLFTWVLVLALQARGIGDGEPSASRPASQDTYLWTIFGLLWGLIALLNSSLLLFFPFCSLWMIWPQRHRFLFALSRVALAASVCILCALPWLARNYHVFHTLVPIRSNFGAELYASSRGDNGGFPYGASVSLFEKGSDLQRYRQIGEMAFVHERKTMAEANFRNHPGRFRFYTLMHLWFYWAGIPHPMGESFLVVAGRAFNYCLISLAGLLGMVLALSRRRPGAILFAAALFFLPLTYYAVSVQARYRAPIEPLLCILIVYLFQSADRSRIWSFQPIHRHP